MKSVLENPENNLSEVTKSNLRRIIKKKLNNEYDYVLLIVGKVGDGKSMLAALACGYIDQMVGNGGMSVDRVFFTAMDYKMQEKKLKPKMSLDFDEGEEIFFSRRAMEKHQKDMILKFAQIRQKNYFIVICTPSLKLLETWLRGIGVETRVNAIWRIIRRGLFYSYSDRTGKLKRIRINPETNSIMYPQPDFIGSWKPIPVKSKYWRDYLRKKNIFISATAESPKVTKERQKIQKMMSESLTIRDICEIQGVSENAVKKWVKEYKVFPKRSVFIDLTGRTRIKFKGYQQGVKKLIRLQQKRRVILAAKIHKIRKKQHKGVKRKK